MGSYYVLDMALMMSRYCLVLSNPAAGLASGNLTGVNEGMKK